MKSSSSKSGLFLMELIIAIGFFAFASAICVQLFAKAHLLSNKSTHMNMAIAAAQSTAECIKSSSDLETVASLLLGDSQGDTLTVQYDSNWNPSPSGRFVLTALVDTNSSPITATIAVQDTEKNEKLFELETKKYRG